MERAAGGGLKSEAHHQHHQPRKQRMNISDALEKSSPSTSWMTTTSLLTSGVDSKNGNRKEKSNSNSNSNSNAAILVRRVMMNDNDPLEVMSRREGADSNENAEAARDQRVKLVEHFRKLNPPIFAGTEGPEAAEIFIKWIEKIYRLLECTVEERVLLATYSLQEEADSWWEATWESIAQDYKGTPWEIFRQAFLDKYFPLTVREDKAREFDLMKQAEDMSVDKYEAKFSKLSRHAPELVGTPEKKAQKFENGLLPRIRKRLAGLAITNYGELYRRAQLIEKTLQDCAELETGKGKRPVVEDNARTFVKMVKRGTFLRRGGPSKAPQHSRFTRRSEVMMPPPKCPRCGKWHAGWRCPDVGGNVVFCYRCGRQGHMQMNCPQNPRPTLTGVLNAQRGRGFGRGGTSQSSSRTRICECYNRIRGCRFEESDFRYDSCE